jgi:tetratricopeptide (TPR) repeat protein
MRFMKAIPAALLHFIIYSCNNQQTADKPNKTSDSISSGKPELSLSDSTITDSTRETGIEQLVEKKQYGKAIAQIDVLLKKNANNPGWLYMKADALEKTGDTSNAILFYENAIRSAGVFMDAEMRVVHLYAQTGNEKTIKLCDDLLKTPAAFRLRSDILLIKGIYYAKILNYKKAVSTYDQLIREDYSYLDAYIEKGLVYYDQAKFAEAHKVFAKSTEVSNKFADGYFWMAKTEEKMNKNTEAINNYKRTLALDQSIEEAREALKRLGAL